MMKTSTSQRYNDAIYSRYICELTFENFPPHGERRAHLVAFLAGKKMLAAGWRRVIGCLKLQVDFCKRANDYRALLRKMSYEDKAER